MVQQEKEEVSVDRSARGRGDDKVDRLIEETEAAIRNTRSFLDHLRGSEQNARELVNSMKSKLEKDLRVLRRLNESDH